MTAKFEFVANVDDLSARGFLVRLSFGFEVRRIASTIYRAAD